MSNDKQNIKDNVTKLIDIELAKNADLEKIEAKELIKRIKDSNKKKDFETKLASIKNLNDLGLLIDNVEKELENQSPNDYLSAKKEALKTKIAASSLEAKKKTNLTNLINNSSDFSSLLDNEIKVNIELIKDGLKKEIKDKIDRLKDNDFKKSVQNSLNKAKNIKDYYDILNKINEYEFNSKKADAIKSLDDLSDQDKKNDFIRELNDLTFAKPNANDELNRIINEINKLKHGQIDFIIDEVKKLPYPNGMDSIAIKDLTKKLDDIKSDNLSNLEKFNKANEIIGKNLDTYKSKINDAKDKISKLSPESAKKANEQLDQTSLLVRDANLPNHSFDELDQRIKDLLVQDKETAKSKINSIPDLKLTKKQKEDLVKLIDNTDTNDWAKITDIINKAEIDVAKKDLEDQAKLLNYPDGDKSKKLKV
ncbi:hypothetical protein NWP96_04025 [Mycoplasmopsis cynos]|nr:hypothetical protein [Mycoplasmopsis cynos]